MIRSAAFAVALLALAACDSGADDDALLGTWTFASVSSQNIGVVSQTQDIIDLARAPEGSLTLSNGEAGSLRYLQGYYSYDGYWSLQVASFDQNAASYPPVRQSLSMSQSAYGTEASLSRDSDAGDYGYYANQNVGDGLQRSAASFTANMTLDSYYSSTPARVTGTITLGHRTLTAGSRSVLSEYAYEFDPSERAQYIFESGGVLRARQVTGNQTVETTGTWTRTGDRIVLSSIEEGTTTSFEYKVQISGSDLLLIADQQSYPCQADCRRSAEQEYGIATGTLTSMTTEETLRLRSSPSVSARAQVAPSGRALPLPAPLESRVTLKPREQ